MGGRPHVRLPPLQSQRAIAQKSVADHKTALSPFRHARLRHQFVAISRRSDKPCSRFHQRNADDAMRFEQFAQRQSRGTKQRGCALIEPAKIVGVEDDFSRIAVSELNSDSNTVYEHSEFYPHHHSQCASTRSLSRVSTEETARDSIERPFHFASLFLCFAYEHHSRDALFDLIQDL